MTFGMVNGIWLPEVKKKLQMFIHFDRIHEGDRHLDGRTDRRTPHDGIKQSALVYSIAGNSSSQFRRTSAFKSLHLPVQSPGLTLTLTLFSLYHLDNTQQAAVQPKQLAVSRLS